MKYVVLAAVAVISMSALCATALAMEHVLVQRDGKTDRVSGRLITEAQDGGLLLLARDGKVWAVQPGEIAERKSDDQPFLAIGPDELHERMLAELPDGFEVYTTAHYTIFHNTSKVYAQWCGALFERLHRGFTNFWDRRQMPIRDAEVPLVAVVFKDKDSYVRYAQSELGEASASIVGYYSLTTNRIATYNLTGIDVRLPASQLTSAAQINRVLSSPEGARTVATVVHEATHQLAFNTGLHERWGDVPMWVSEGIAVYFETPDLNSSKGWRTIGAINRGRLFQFQKYARQRPPDSLAELLADDERFRGPETALNAYAEAWALNYYLLSARSADYVTYLKKIAENPPLNKDTPEQRVQKFRDAFGADLKGFDESFMRQILRLR